MKKLILMVASLLFVVFTLVWLKFNSNLFLSSQSRGAINQIHSAFVQVESAQEKLSPASNDRDKLERMYDLDQCGREAFSHLDFSVLPEAERDIARHVAWKEIDEHDQINRTELKKLIPKDGWFKKSIWGDKAADAAFYIAQHAGNDLELMRMALARQEPLLASGEVDPFNYARMYDRVALFFDHKPQRYGTQFTCRDGVFQPNDMEDPEHVDERRKAIGLTTTAAENLKNIQTEQGASCR